MPYFQAAQRHDYDGCQARLTQLLASSYRLRAAEPRVINRKLEARGWKLEANRDKRRCRQMSDTVASILRYKGRHVWSVGPEESVFQAISLMADKGIGSL